MELKGRNILFKSLIGVNNYNLYTPNCKTYYKSVVLPNFDDLYLANIIEESCSLETNTNREGICDIRKYIKHLIKPDIYFIESLFSDEIILNNTICNKSKSLVSELLNYKDDITKINLSYLYDSCIGIYNSKMHSLLKCTSKTEYMIKNYGYNVEHAFEAWRLLDLLRRFADTNFSDFKFALKYDDADPKNVFLRRLVNGEFSLNEFNEIIDNTFRHVEENFKTLYKNSIVSEHLHDRLHGISKELVKINL